MFRSNLIVISVTILLASVAAGDVEFLSPTNLGATINSAYNEQWPYISPDGNLIIFSSNRPGSINDSYDLWMSEKINGVWQTPINLGSVINTGRTEAAAWLSPDRKRLYFSGDRWPRYNSYDFFVSTWSDTPTIYTVDEDFDGKTIDCFKFYIMNNPWSSDFKFSQDGSLIVQGTQSTADTWSGVASCVYNGVFNANERLACSVDVSFSVTGSGARVGLVVENSAEYAQRDAVGIYLSKEGATTYRLIEVRQDGVPTYIDLGAGAGSKIGIVYERPSAKFYIDDVEVGSYELDLYDLMPALYVFTKSSGDQVYATLDNLHIESDLPAGWQMPVNLGLPICSMGDEWSLSLTKDERTFYFTSNRPAVWPDYDHDVRKSIWSDSTLTYVEEDSFDGSDIDTQRYEMGDTNTGLSVSQGGGKLTISGTQTSGEDDWSCGAWLTRKGILQAAALEAEVDIEHSFAGYLGAWSMVQLNSYDWGWTVGSGVGRHSTRFGEQMCGCAIVRHLHRKAFYLPYNGEKRFKITYKANELKYYADDALLDSYNIFFPGNAVSVRLAASVGRLGDSMHADFDNLRITYDIPPGWQLPINLGPNINTTDLNEQGVAVNGSGSLMIVQSPKVGGYGGDDLYVSQLIGGVWQEMVNLGSAVNTDSAEGGPSLTSNGGLLFFHSDRPGGFGGTDIWVSRARAFSMMGSVNFADNSPNAIATIKAYNHETEILENSVSTAPGGGSYTLSGFMPGTYDLVVSATRYTTTTLWGIVISDSDKNLPPVTLQPTTEPMYQVSGSVYFADGSTGAFAKVTLYEDDTDNAVEWAYVGPGGGPYVLLNIPNGTYDIKVTAAGYQEDADTLANTTVNDSDLTGKDVTLEILAGTVWSNLSPTGDIPCPRRGASAIYDDVNHKLLLFGGQNIHEYDTDPYNRNNHLNDLYELDLSSNIWTKLNPGGDIPPKRRFHSAMLDKTRRRMIILYGWAGFSGIPSLDDCYEYLLDTNTWNELVMTGTVPSARGSQSAIYDEINDRMIIFGGYGAPDPNTYSLDLSTNTWSILDVTGTIPLGRILHTGVLDENNRRMIIFGGSSGGLSLNDTSILDLSSPLTWSHIGITANTPGGRNAHSAIINSKRNSMVIFGGHLIGRSDNDVHKFNLSTDTWFPLDPRGDKPDKRGQHVSIYNPHNDSMVIFGGLVRGDYYFLFNDTYALYFNTAPLAGRVTDSVSGEPVEDAAISIPAIETVLSDEFGFYDFLLPIGYSYDMYVNATGYYPASQTSVSVTTDTITRVNFALVPETVGAVVGLVTDASTGAKIAGANVTASGAGSDTTGSDGKYSIGNVPEGANYTVSVSVTGYLPGERTGITVNAGLATSVNFKLCPSGKGIIQGKVTEKDTGIPVAGVGISASGGGFGYAETDENGRYEMYVASGTGYTVSATANGYVQDSGSVQTGIVVNEGSATVVDLTLTDAHSVPWAPTGLTLTAGDTLIDLSWDENPESDIRGYNIYRRTASGSYGDPINANPVPATYFRNGGLSNGTTYFYEVTAVDYTNYESSPCPEQSATPSDLAPEPPTGLTAAPLSGGMVRLDWYASVSPDVLKYNIYSDSGTGVINYSPSGLAGEAAANYPGWVSGALTVGQPYKFGVRTVDQSSNEEQNTDVVIEITPVASISQWTKVSITNPRAGSNIAGNQVTIEAQLVDGCIPNVRYVAFEYKPASSSVWQAMESYAGANESPDYSSPYFVYWDTSSLTPGEYDIRAVAWDMSDSPDPGPVANRVTIASAGGGGKRASWNMASMADAISEFDCDIMEYVNAEGEHVKIQKVYPSMVNRIRIGGELGRITELVIPENAIAEDTYLSMTICNADNLRDVIGSSNVSIDEIIEIELQSGQETLLEGNAELTVPYDDFDDDGIVDETTIGESNLALFCHSSTQHWQEIERVMDVDENTVSGSSSNLGLFAIFSKSNVATIPANKAGRLFSGRTVFENYRYWIRNATGNCNNGSTSYGPDGIVEDAPSGWLAPGVRKYSLLGKLGDSSDVFFIGTSTLEERCPTTAKMYFGYNEDLASNFDDNTGSFRVVHSVSYMEESTAARSELWILYP